MTERPIIFSGNGVRAILDGRKTQTRRVMRPQPECGELLRVGLFAREVSTRDGSLDCGPERYGASSECECIACPFGAPGDHLWVREAWHPAARLGTEYEVEYRADRTARIVDAGWEGPTPAIDAAIARSRWRSPIYLPRWASRITLEVIEVRVQRVQDISEEGAVAEGCPRPETLSPSDCGVYPGAEKAFFDALNQPRRQFRDVWDSVNAKRGYPWASDPWVWVVSFRRAERQ